MKHHKATTVFLKPSSYELGQMYYKQGRAYNPYMQGTEAYADFERGFRSEKVKHDMELRRTQFHA